MHFIIRLHCAAAVLAVNGQPGLAEVVQEKTAGATATFSAQPGDAAYWSVVPDGSSRATTPIILGQVCLCVKSGTKIYHYPDTVIGMTRV